MSAERSPMDHNNPLLTDLMILNSNNRQSTSTNTSNNNHDSTFINLPFSMALECPTQVSFGDNFVDPIHSEKPSVVKEGWVFKRGKL